MHRHPAARRPKSAAPPNAGIPLFLAATAGPIALFALYLLAVA